MTDKRMRVTIGVVFEVDTGSPMDLEKPVRDALEAAGVQNVVQVWWDDAHVIGMGTNMERVYESRAEREARRRQLSLLPVQS